MKQQVCYTSLAIYSKQDITQDVCEALQRAPSRTGERNGTYSWIYSTQNESGISTVEQHIDLLKEYLNVGTEALIRMSREGCEMRVWIYFGLTDANQAFVVPPRFLAWLASFGADICVDIWSD